MKVYLYELDSVRKTPAEIQIAQERLFKETVGNGNTVVLSANQIVDGEGFIYGLYGDNGDKNYDTILELFRTGMIKVCKFTDEKTKKQVESLVEYRMNNMEREQFCFSGVGKDLSVRAYMRDAYENGAIYKLDEWVEKKTDETEKKNAKYVRRVIKLIYELGMYNIWEEEDTEIRVTFEDLMNYILHPKSMGVQAQKQYNDTIKDCPEILCAIDLLHKLDKTIESGVRNRRSPWREPKEKLNPTGFTIYQTASAEDKANAQIIIDLCYNIAVESGIAGISVEYGTPHRTGKKGTRLSGQQIQEIREEQCVHLLKKIKKHVEDRQSAPAEITREQIELPMWGDALDVINETDLKEKRKNEEEAPFPPPRKIPKMIEAQRKKWNKKFDRAIRRRIQHLLRYLLILVLVICLVDPVVEPSLKYIIRKFAEFLRCIPFVSVLKSVPLFLRIVSYVTSHVSVYSAITYIIAYLLTYLIDWFIQKKGSGEDAVQTVCRVWTLLRKKNRIEKYLTGMGWFSRQVHRICTHCKETTSKIFKKTAETEGR
ncbi:MAG: hypothetical protein LIO95_00795 [Clostridiales bacterium]|nr:hypothetical protein [Clostridiales bacterium]